MPLVVTNKGTLSIGGQRTYQDAYGWHIFETYRCSFSENVTEAIKYQTLADMKAAVGVNYGTLHTFFKPPDYGTYFCCKVEPVIENLREGTVKLEYKTVQWIDIPSDDAVIEVGSSVVTVETNKDIHGKDITVKYTFTGDALSKAKEQYTEIAEDGTVEVSAPVQFLFPEHTRRYNRKESSSPENKAIFYVGRTNSDNWKNGAPGEWLCRSILGRSNDGGDTFHVNYDFERRPIDESQEGWKGLAYFVDKSTGRPPKDLVDGTSRKWIELYYPVDFNDLNL